MNAVSHRIQALNSGMWLFITSKQCISKYTIANLGLTLYYGIKC
mgnify:CR=1 FL=1